MEDMEKVADEIEKDLDSIMYGGFPKRNTVPKERPLFVCRICGCTKYEGVYGDSSLVPLGGRMYPMAYQCKGCSVVFKNFEKFSTDKTKRQIPEPEVNITDAEQKWFDGIAKKLSKKTATLPIKPAHVEFVNKDDEKELDELKKKLKKA